MTARIDRHLPEFANMARNHVYGTADHRNGQGARGTWHGCNGGVPRRTCLPHGDTANNSTAILSCAVSAGFKRRNNLPEEALQMRAPSTPLLETPVTNMSPFGKILTAR